MKTLQLNEMNFIKFTLDWQSKLSSTKVLSISSLPSAHIQNFFCFVFELLLNVIETFVLMLFMNLHILRELNFRIPDRGMVAFSPGLLETDSSS